MIKCQSEGEEEAWCQSGNNEFRLSLKPNFQSPCHCSSTVTYIALLFITGHGGRQQYLPPTGAYDVGHGMRIRDNAEELDTAQKAKAGLSLLLEHPANLSSANLNRS